MELKILPHTFTVCKAVSPADIDLSAPFCFVGATDEELSVVCPVEYAPAHTLEREDGWRGFRIQGVLDFSLIGILSRLSGILVQEGIGIFAVSTFNTDYILLKAEQLDRAAAALSAEGYAVTE